MQLFYCVYLGALRDAERFLQPGRGNMLGQLFLKLRSTPDQQPLAKELNQSIKQLPNWQNLLNEAKTEINEHLIQMSILPQKVDIDFLPLEFRKIVENLKMYIPIQRVVKKNEILEKFKDDAEWEKYFDNPNDDALKFKANFEGILAADDILSPTNRETLQNIYLRTVKSFELIQNGLGYNNLIYIATVIGNLLERKKTETNSYISLLIEEPEAHLHPQLQNVLFNYFRTMQKKQIQVFITSHSPTITAKSNLDSLIIAQIENLNINTVSLRNFNLEDKEKKYLSRFLDVTKSQLFFAKGVIFVEGISEALLIPILAKKMNTPYDLDKEGIEITNISGVAFEPFARLFNNSEFTKRLHSRGAIITDDDRNEHGQISPRAQNAQALQDANLKVFLANFTFEYELFISGNGEIMVQTYTELHPRFELQGDSLTSKATNFVNALKDKAIFAQLLTNKLSDDTNFIVPTYIKNAIKWVVGK